MRRLTIHVQFPLSNGLRTSLKTLVSCQTPFLTPVSYSKQGCCPSRAIERSSLVRIYNGALVKQSIKCNFHDEGRLQWISNTLYILLWLYNDRLLFAHLLMTSSHMYLCLSITRLLSIFSSCVIFNKSVMSFSVTEMFHLSIFCLFFNARHSPLFNPSLSWTSL